MKKCTITTLAAFSFAFFAFVGAEANALELAKPSTPNPGLKYYYPVPKASNPVEGNYDVVVYGGTPGGVAAAIQAKRMGKTAALYVFRRHVGGLTSAGLTETDLGKKEAIGGMAVEFFEKVGKWRHFRPSEAEKTFLTMLAEADVPVFFEHRLHKVEKDGLKITKITFENGNSAKGKMFVDATYEGDLFAKAGISYMVGREDNSMFGEDYNGTYFSKTSHVYRHQFDPYVKPGDPSSGLLEGITDTKVDKLGVGDKKLQSYCFRTWAMKDGKHVPWPKPEEYRTERYEILKRYVNAAPSPDFWDLRYKHGPVKLNEGDCNNAGPVSIDYVGGNFGWAEGSYAEREKIFQDHVNYQKGFMYFLANDPSIPESLRKRVSEYGLDAYEFPETDNWPHELYVREARRLHSDYVMTQANCTGKTVAEDSVGLGSYTMDSHHVERVMHNGQIANEGGFEKGIKSSYPVSYRSIVPKRSECSNLFVPVALSSSHVAFGSIRMEPVFMVLGQSAATAASMAIDEGIPAQDVNYPKLREKLLQDGQILEPPRKMKLVWADEFNVDGKPNPDFWNYEQGFVRNRERQWYQPENAYCKDGVLVLEARIERKPNPNYEKGSKDWTKEREFIDYTSSSITTSGKKEFKYGRLEVRARIPVGKSAWPAIWTLGSKSGENVYPWPSCGEVDVMEFYRIDGVPTILANAAWGSKGENVKSVWDNAKIPFGEFLKKDPDWASNFHVWRMDWDENFIRIYLDGNLLNEVDLSKTVNGEKGGKINPFRRPHYFLLNLALRPEGADKLDKNAFPMKYEIDYIRFYQ